MLEARDAPLPRYAPTPPSPAPFGPAPTDRDRYLCEGRGHNVDRSAGRLGRTVALARIAVLRTKSGPGETSGWQSTREYCMLWLTLPMRATRLVGLVFSTASNNRMDSSIFRLPSCRMATPFIKHSSNIIRKVYVPLVRYGRVVSVVEPDPCAALSPRFKNAAASRWYSSRAFSFRISSCPVGLGVN